MNQETVTVEKIIDIGDGSGAQRFVGTGETETDALRDLADKMATAQEHATRKIRAQALQIKTGKAPEGVDPDTPAPTYAARELTAEEQLQLATDIGNPATFGTALDQAIEARTGLKPAQIGQLATQLEQERRQRAAAQECEQWIGAHPDYHVCGENGQRLARYLELHGMAVTARNLDSAFAELSAEGLLIAAPATGNETEPAAEEAVPTPTEAPVERPRATPAASSLRRGNGSAQPAPPPTKATKYTRAQIDAMPSAEYKQRLQERSFREEVERLYSAR